ncbi:hypothetical protein DFA_09897 [Cavenderia fasciculata]|uniref:Paramecium surface antigen repeat-containing protein n=1 Tax=Cavenderia fasciculata TaxID=261658 RepID=F4Q8Q5_CACFS|nr:uncharacterized protein DFA_09897 [Cavenderia fasciculata]EGG15074.1 hypothetical protein DFA_09897 [Cavenderia fasciculata]|eukprot:XP_004351794.1 hypothetical protein DFA_09897 [Cavenderia fasciculata]
MYNCTSGVCTNPISPSCKTGSGTNNALCPTNQYCNTTNAICEDLRPLGANCSGLETCQKGMFCTPVTQYWTTCQPRFSLQEGSICRDSVQCDSTKNLYCGPQNNAIRYCEKFPAIEPSYNCYTNGSCGNNYICGCSSTPSTGSCKVQFALTQECQNVFGKYTDCINQCPRVTNPVASSCINSCNRYGNVLPVCSPYYTCYKYQAPTDTSSSSVSMSSNQKEISFIILFFISIVNIITFL